jgi:hypothetical protein
VPGTFTVDPGTKTIRFWAKGTGFTGVWFDFTLDGGAVTYETTLVSITPSWAEYTVSADFATGTDLDNISVTFTQFPNNSPAEGWITNISVEDADLPLVQPVGHPTVGLGAAVVAPSGIPAPLTDELAGLGFNGDFETDLSGWVVAGTSGAAIFRDTTESYSGSASLKLVHEGGGPSEADNSATAYANGAGPKRATIWMKASNAEDVDVYFYSGETDGDWTNESLTTVSVTTEWAAYEFEFDQVGSMFTAIDFDQKDVHGALPGTALWVDAIKVGGTFGTATVSLGPGAQTLYPTGITMPTDMGTPTVTPHQGLNPTGIPTAEVFGGPITLHQELFFASPPSERSRPAAERDNMGRPDLLHRRTGIPRGITVYVIDGVYHETTYVPDDLVADAIYFGGRDYQVDADQATELEAHGFTIRTEIR